MRNENEKKLCSDDFDSYTDYKIALCDQKLASELKWAELGDPETLAVRKRELYRQYTDMKSQIRAQASHIDALNKINISREYYEAQLREYQEALDRLQMLRRRGQQREQQGSQLK